MGKKSSAAFSDKRFAHLKEDPKFVGLPQKHRKAKIDSRFAAILTDEKFGAKPKIDKYGRRLRKKDDTMKQMYEMEDEEEKSESSESGESESESGESSDEGVINSRKRKIDLARGEGNVESSSDDDSEGGDLDEHDEEFDMELAQLDNDAERIQWASRRLAACNLDWDKVKCEDILFLADSFKPGGGEVQRVTIYVSDFGVERLKEEEEKGPRLNLPVNYDENNPAMKEIARAAVKKYQLEKLKYYYAVIECDTEQTASAIYDECDGFQFEICGLKMDLRFVPDDMAFDESRIHETITLAEIDKQKYKPKIKPTNEIMGTGDKMVWDEDVERKRRLEDAFKDDEAAIEKSSALIASSDSEDDDQKEEKRRALLSLLEDKPKEEEMKIQWSDGEDESESDGEGYQKVDSSDDEIGIKDKESGSEDEDDEVKEEAKPKLSKYKQYLERKKSKKRELKSGKKSQKVDEKTLDSVAEDPRFKALFTDSAFAIESSSAKVRKSSELGVKQAEIKKAKRAAQTNTQEDLIEKLKRKAGKMAKK
ncbi:hypothetical protein WR25_18497 [Diploscapter pachys]|uniref:Uncharacterized protein n=1 Tax=Diploscapter pachys TaxID=2018661 RepID=A0A2A2JEJ7_9BILA|nr:hypothetical protein WR25_18497 [Diploscapter pachys]